MDVLRDRIAFGIKYVNLKKKFLKENLETLTLDKLVQYVKLRVLSELRLKSIVSKEKSVNKREILRKNNSPKNTEGPRWGEMWIQKILVPSLE